MSLLDSNIKEILLSFADGETDGWVRILLDVKALKNFFGTIWSAYFIFVHIFKSAKI